MQKKGQITLFIIIGFLLVLAAGLFFMVYSNEKGTVTAEQPEVVFDSAIDSDSVKGYVTSCIEKVSEPLILGIAASGGTLNPDSEIRLEGEKLNTLSTYISNFGYDNKVLSVKDMESELENNILPGVRDCINLDVFREDGFDITEGTMSLKVMVAKEDVNLVLSYPLKLAKGDRVIDLSSFPAKIDLPLKRAYTTALDIMNEEAEKGNFDKENFMLSQGDKVRIKKYKPYPDTIYVINVSNALKSKNIVFRFAIKGNETVERSVIRYSQKGCCKNEGEREGTCIKNVDEGECSSPLAYDSSQSCECQKNTEPAVEGCCSVSGICLEATKTKCQSLNGRFFEGDLKCANAQCPNLDCEHTYNYVEDDYSGGKRKNGESWCVYESPAGNGLDYVGTRHYLHSCINGKEYVEPCRDFREEMCVEQSTIISGDYYKKAACRVNRWYDCSLQGDQASCEDKTKRDCEWAGFLKSEKKCHPETAPGLKFWEAESRKVCNLANLPLSRFGYFKPYQWSYGALLYCQRTGDCGNYRNIADDITRLGYYNPDVVPEENNVYWGPGEIRKGNSYAIKLSLNSTFIPSSTTVPKGSPSGYARCSEWVAPNTNKCHLCMNSSLHPCTEYKCKSLGINCVFKEDDKTCVVDGAPDKTPPQITLNSIRKGYSSSLEGGENNIMPKINPYETINFSIKTSEDTRCKLSLRPEGVSAAAILASFDCYEYALNDYDYKSYYNVSVRFPSSALISKEYVKFFIECHDKAGNYNSAPFTMKININESFNDTYAPKILMVNPPSEEIVKGGETSFSIYTNEPFDSCRYSFTQKAYDQMTRLFCITEESDYDMCFREIPFGSYECSASISVPQDAENIFFSCQDKKGNINAPAAYKIG